MGKIIIDALASSGISDAEYIRSVTSRIIKGIEKENFVADLRKIGFLDESHDKNGMGYRKDLPGGLMQLCFYIYESHIRFQTVGSGITIVLEGVNNLAQLDAFCKLLLNKSV